MSISNLWLVMPVYNEEEAIGSVVAEWTKVLEQQQIKYTFCILNDGSKDSTLAKLQAHQQADPRIKIVDKQNTGHGQTCVMGYRLALENKADWVFQLDSDGQCDPAFFESFVQNTAQYKAIFGYRNKREDGFPRFLISRFVSLFSYAATGVWLRDANVPYRLMNAAVLNKVLPFIHDDFYLANIYLSILIRKQTKIHWIDIVFRERAGGSPSIKTYSIMKHGIKLFKQLKATANAKV
ncbi:hypothetical protein DBR32_12970 [Taibaiella sp. KBW10]|uniref:glycosyltransferase family 2 protein n=1 Tax=Taibaiella sp. KBW10 TaxID=2153357 RepID=UPI000F59063A|nr:glycosyltransferase family 2 protein [Taibaiella sp. KBW10]RQO30471.1 hypothetical protein DBR32_12970 [Taibaiella sp. KBW10]